MKSPLRKNNGITLIELLVALVITSILVAAVYRTFLSQQKTYTVQEQVVDMQQNVRAGINRMMREIRMAGFGASMVLPGFTVNGQTFNNVVNPDTPVADSLTIVSATGSTTLALAGIPASNMITVNSLTDSQGNTLFDTGNRRYVSIGGVESFTITNILGTTLTLSGNLTYNHPVGTPVFGIRAISYQVGMVSGIPTLLRDENTGAGSQPLVDNIETLQFGYLNANGNPTANPPDIRVVRVTLKNTTNISDPEYKSDGGYRKREISSNVHLMNMGLEGL
jgi:prepilin-type N-terminal cleavage/methylation domain-containing protein